VGKPDAERNTVDKHQIQEQRIERSTANIQEAIDKLRALIQEAPETPIKAVNVRSWVLAMDINLQTLKQTLHDLQPTLF